MPFKPITTQRAAPPQKGGKKKKHRKDAVKEELISLEEERVYREGTVAIRDLIAPSAFRVESTFIQLGEVFLRTLFVISYPRYISVGWSAPILNLNMTVDVSMFFYPVKSRY